MNGAAHLANRLRIAGTLLELKAAFIHGLEKLRRALEENLAKLDAAFVVENHCAPSIRWYTVALFR